MSTGADGALPPDRYRLRLYITGNRPCSRRAIETVRAICEQHLKGRYDLEVVDLYEAPERALAEQIVAAPTLVKELPPPVRRVVGEILSSDRLLLALDIRPGG